MRSILILDDDEIVRLSLVDYFEEAYVGFESADDSKRAMDLHRKSMGSRYIELFLSNKEEHGRALVRFGNR